MRVMLFLLSVSMVCHWGIAQEKPAFQPLFNGKDLTGWTTYLKDEKADPKQTWSIADGVIKCTGKPNGYLLTEKEYSNYIFKMKWRFPAGSKGGNSGVLLHCTGPNRVWPNSIEAQLKSGFAGDIWLNADEQGVMPTLTIDPKQKDTANKQGRHFFRLQPMAMIEKPFGEWNEYEITCKNGEITLVVNGTKTNYAKDCSLKKGRIAIQSEGAEVHFKDIEIQELR